MEDRRNRPRVVEERPEYQSRPEMRSLSSFPAFRTVGEKPKGPLERLLSFFADVRAGEGLSAVLMTLNVFLLLGSYYLLKTAREPLILVEQGAAVKSYAAGAQAVLLMILVPLYGLVGSKVVRVKLITGLTLFFISHLLIFATLGFAGTRIGVYFYVWVGIFNAFVISQFWAFANDIYTEGQGKRLFPMIGVGSSLGAWLGSEAASWLFKAYSLTPYHLMLSAAAVLCVTAALTWIVNRRESREAEMARHADQPLGTQDGFAIIFKSRYLTLIALLIVLLNVVNTTGEFLLGSLVTQEAAQVAGGDPAAQKAFIGGFYGRYFSGVNLLGAILQIFVVSRVFQFIGVRGALYVLPCLAFLSYSVIAVAPVLLVVRIVKTLENSTDYSLQNTVRQTLFLPTSRDAKFKAKAAIDTFFMRFGDVLQAGLVAAGTSLSIGTMGFAWMNLALTLVWLWIAGQLSREHRRLAF